MPRSNQTKQLLAQSLQELMATTPLEKISVNDIVDHANVGRNTFYYHFEDKYDLVNWYFQSGITRFLVELSAYSSWNALLAALETYFLENKVFYCNALSYNGQNSLQQYMFDYLRSIFEQNVRELSPRCQRRGYPQDRAVLCRCDDGYPDSVGAQRHEEQRPVQHVGAVDPGVQPRDHAEAAARRSAINAKINRPRIRS